MSRDQAEQVAGQFVAKLCEAGYPVSALYLFGSYAKNTFHRWSDIDVAVISDAVERDYFGAQKTLRDISAEVDVRLEPHGFSPSDFAEDWQPVVHEIKTTGRLLFASK